MAVFGRPSEFEKNQSAGDVAVVEYAAHRAIPAIVQESLGVIDFGDDLL